MRGLKIPLLIALLVSLGFGIGLGLKLKRDRETQLGVVSGARKLRILAWTGAFPPDVVRHFGAGENVQVELAEEATPDAVFKRLQASPDFDLVTLLTTQTAKAIETTTIQVLKPQEIAGFNSVSRDFVDLPGRSSVVVPFLWGLSAARQTQDDDDGAKVNIRGAALKEFQVDGVSAFQPGSSEGRGSLWILNLALASNAKNVDEAKAFLSYVLKPETAIAISTATRQRSTNIGVEPSALAAPLKPSALRSVPLTVYDLILDEPKETPRAQKETSPGD